MTEGANALDPARCPLCGDANRCAMAANPDAAHCWCFDATIASGALERLPAEARGVVCICSRCANEADDSR